MVVSIEINSFCTFFFIFAEYKERLLFSFFTGDLELIFKLDFLWPRIRSLGSLKWYKIAGKRKKGRLQMKNLSWKNTSHCQRLDATSVTCCDVSEGAKNLSTFHWRSFQRSITFTLFSQRCKIRRSMKIYIFVLRTHTLWTFSIH